MASFPWDQLKAETLRLMCKDLRAGSAIKRNRENMISFLVNIGESGLTAASATASGGSNDAPRNSEHTSETAAKSPSPTEPEGHGGMDIAEADSMEPDSNCHCQEGWLSPRLKFILSTTAAVASDLIRDTGEFAEEFGHIGGVYLAQYIPEEVCPRGKKAAGLWVDGFSTIFGVIHKMFEDGNIPTIDKLEHALSQLPKDKQKLTKAYGKQGAGLDSVLEALVFGAKEDWEQSDFEAVHCNGKKWRAIPTCTEHDLNWTLAEDMLLD